MSDNLLEKLRDLLVQATTEQTHFYVAACLRSAIAEIERLRTALTAAKMIDEDQKKRIEELEKAYKVATSTEHLPPGCGKHIITTYQIRAAWEHANTHVEVESKLVEFALNELGIVRDGDGWRMG